MYHRNIQRLFLVNDDPTIVGTCTAAQTLAVVLKWEGGGYEEEATLCHNYAPGTVTAAAVAPSDTDYGPPVVTNLYLAATQLVYQCPYNRDTKVLSACTVLAGAGTTGYVDASGANARFQNIISLHGNPFDGWLYVYDSAPNYRLRIIELSTQDVHTIGGDGSDGSTASADHLPVRIRAVTFAANDTGVGDGDRLAAEHAAAVLGNLVLFAAVAAFHCLVGELWFQYQQRCRPSRVDKIDGDVVGADGDGVDSDVADLGDASDDPSSPRREVRGKAAKPPKTRLRCLGDVRFPGMLMVPLLFLYHTTVTSSVVVFLEGTHVALLAIATAGAIACLAAFCGVAFMLRYRFFARRREYHTLGGDEPKMTKVPSASPRTSSPHRPRPPSGSRCWTSARCSP